LKRPFKSALLACLYALMSVVAQGLRLGRWQRSLIDRHVARCLPEFDAPRRAEIAAGFYRYLGELAAEVLYLPFLSREELAERVRLENPELVAGRLAGQRKVLILSAHQSNWEWLLLRCSTGFEAPLTAVYKKLDNDRLDRFVRSLRERFGCTMVRTRDVVQHLIERRGEVRLLAMLADQSPPPRNQQQIWTDFFGQPTAFHSGPGWIAARMGYTPVFAAVRRERRGRYAVRLVPLVPEGTRAEPERVLRAYVEALEAHVRDDPAHYFWAYNRWKCEKPLYA
jgi:KDO2-lipid IV(A) lauroyltransferase